jgi:general secretion pathway protein E/type IV pilus assembly protein PilB
MQSSDIHIETYEEFCRIRYRIDGKLLEKHRLEKENYPALINKNKSEHRYSRKTLTTRWSHTT